MKYEPIDLKQEMKDIARSSLKIPFHIFILFIATFNALNADSKVWLFFHILTVMLFTRNLTKFIESKCHATD